MVCNKKFRPNRMKFIICSCGTKKPEKIVRISRALFLSTGDGSRIMRKTRNRESGFVAPQNMQHWKISAGYNATALIYSSKRNWFIGLPRLIYPSLLRLRTLLNSIPHDSLAAGALWIFFEIDAPDYIEQHVLYIIVSLLVYLLDTRHPGVSVLGDARLFLAEYPQSRSLERYINEAKTLMSIRQPVQASHIIIRSFIYTGGLDINIVPAGLGQASTVPVKLVVSVCNQRIGQFDQSYFTTWSSSGGLFNINQSVNATDEIVFSFYVRNLLVSRFQSIGFALIDSSRGPLKLLRDDLSEYELYVEANETFFFEVFAECLQWLGHSDASGTSLVGHAATQYTAADSDRTRTVASRLNPQSGIQLTNEEKCSIILSALPSYAFKPLEKQEGESDDEYTLRTQCQICLGDYEEGEEVRALPCMHVFHAPCVESWLHVRVQCPNCCAEIADLLADPGDVNSHRTDNVI